jgi:hypothetical protein
MAVTRIFGRDRSARRSLRQNGRQNVLPRMQQARREYGRSQRIGVRRPAELRRPARVLLPADVPERSTGAEVGP